MSGNLLQARDPVGLDPGEWTHEFASSDEFNAWVASSANDECGSGYCLAIVGNDEQGFKVYKRTPRSPRFQLDAGRTAQWNDPDSDARVRTAVGNMWETAFDYTNRVAQFAVTFGTASLGTAVFDEITDYLTERLLSLIDFDDIDGAAQLFGAARLLLSRGGARQASRGRGSARARPRCQGAECATAEAACFGAGTGVLTAEGLRPIETIEVGSRVLTARSVQDPSLVNEETWLVGDFSFESDESRSTISVLRPVLWFAFNGVFGVGDRVWLENPELQLAGWATLRELRAAKVDNGTGQVVTTVVAHTVEQTVRLALRGHDQTVELITTPQHRLFSNQRSAWVPVSELVPGETLTSADGVVSVASIVETVGEVDVYNMEVESHHEFLVSELHVRAHNDDCWLAQVLDHLGISRDDIPHWMDNPHGHHIIPHGMTTGRNR